MSPPVAGSPHTSSAQASVNLLGQPAFRRPSISSVEFECPPRAMNSEM
jgi:hypothetical protein